LTTTATAQPATGDKTTPHSITIPSGKLDFDASVATTKLADPKGAVQAEIVTTAFLLKGAEAHRPITFAVNGGPGASSAWLDFGAIGPWRVPFGNPVIPSAAPTPIDNADTWLDQTDLVFIDPPGTGYSRVTGGDDARRQFLSVDGDIDTLAVVIRRWLEAHGRLLSPKFIVGESYGGFRGPKLARTLLDKQGVGINGLFLISPVLDFNGRDAPWNPFRYVVTLPSMAAAYRHAQSRADLADVETYAAGDFLSDLIRGEADTEATDRLATRVSAITGLDPALVRRRLGRIGLSTFLRDQTPGRVDSPYDATISAADPFPAAANDNSPDPILDGLRAPVTSAALYVYKTWLEWQPEGAPNRQYELLNDQVAHEWDYGRRMTRPDAYSDLRQYLALDPTSRAVVAHGLTDLVTPYFADALLLRQTPDFNDKHQLSLVVYPGGHMFYSRDDSRAALHRDAVAFFTGTRP
jgi:carboxypeptidase C (cathepsin A)